MRRCRRPHQLALARTAGWGGRREGAGRPPIRGRRRPVPHRAREEHKAAHPVHLTLRARAGLLSLRGEGVFGAIRDSIRAGSSELFRVLQFSVQSDHVHLIVEAEADALGSGAAGLAIRLARAINRALGRRGAVWGDRYHVRALRTPREVRHALIYVLMNFRKHRPWDDRGSTPARPPAGSTGFASARRNPLRTLRPSVRRERGWRRWAGGGMAQSASRSSR